MQEQQVTSRQGISKHFKRESKWMLWLFIGIPVMLAALGFLAEALGVPQFLYADACLDRGGRISPETQKCELPEPKPASQP